MFKNFFNIFGSKKDKKQKPETNPNYIFIEKGSFLMGDIYDEGESQEFPAHGVEIEYNFFLSKYLVTFSDFDKYCEEKNIQKPDDNNWGRERKPVINLTWYDAVAYCNWLSSKEDLFPAYDINGNLLNKKGEITKEIKEVYGYRLPTEAEWEYAAKGGNTGKAFKYSGSNNSFEVAWFWHNSAVEGVRQTQPVGRKKANLLGLYDMSGNVWEWCTDWYDNEYYKKSKGLNPYNFETAPNKSIRGGAWNGYDKNVRVSVRTGYSPNERYYALGFRICKTII